MYSKEEFKKKSGGDTPGRGDTPRTPVAGGGDPLPHPPPARPSAVHGRSLRDRSSGEEASPTLAPPHFKS